MTRAVEILASPLLALLASAATVPAVLAQDDDEVERIVPQMPANPPDVSAPSDKEVGVDALDLGEGNLPTALLHVPLTGVFPDAIPPDIHVVSPVVDDPDAAYRGMGYFNQFNCIGCHAPNGAGGMGPSLSNSSFKYGGDPENIYLTIVQGRPMGMPAFGSILPDSVIWDLAAYVRAISEDDTGQWGRTTSVDHFKIEQVPSEYQTGVDPWQHTQPFSFGQPPFEKVETPEKQE